MSKKTKRKNKTTRKILPVYKVENGKAKFLSFSDCEVDKRPKNQTSTAKEQQYIGKSNKSIDRVRKAVNLANIKSNQRLHKKRSEKKLFNSALESYDNICNGEEGLIILKVRKGKHVFQPHYCADCLSVENPIWRYQNSNYGLIYLCNICKILAFERTFGHADAMPLKVDHAHAHKGKWS